MRVPFFMEKVMTKLHLNESELAKRWGVSPKTLQRWRSEGRGPRYLKLSKRVTYPIEEIQKYESKSLYASTSERASDITLRCDSTLVTAEDIAAAASCLPIDRPSVASENAHEVVQPIANLVMVSSIQGDSKSGMVARSVSAFISDADAARATRLPRCYFSNAVKRAEMEIPHYLIGRSVRFKLEEILQWEVLQTHQCRSTSVDPIAAIFEKANAVAGTPDPASSVSVPAETGPAKMTLIEALRLKNSGFGVG